MGNCGLRRVEQQQLGRLFPGVAFAFQNEYDDDANEEAAGP
jgi:hypothetical protein